MNELKQAIAKGELSPLYILYGEETYLLEHYLKLMRKNTDEFDYKNIDGLSESVQDIAEAALSLPLAGTHVFVEVRDMDMRGLKEADLSVLDALFNDLPDTCRLVFAYSAVEWKPDKRKKFWKTLEKHAKLVDFKTQDERELISWVGRHFAAEGKTISRQNAQFLIRFCGKQMNTLNCEISKIAAFSAGSEITEPEIRAVALPQLEAAIFDCAEALIRGDTGYAFRQFGTLLEIHKNELNDQAIPMIAALSWRFRNEYRSQLRFGRRSPMLDWSADAVLSCAGADLRCKSSSADDRVILTDLFVTLAAKRRFR